MIRQGREFDPRSDHYFCSPVFIDRCWHLSSVLAACHPEPIFCFPDSQRNRLCINHYFFIRSIRWQHRLLPYIHNPINRPTKSLLMKKPYYGSNDSSSPASTFIFTTLRVCFHLHHSTRRSPYGTTGTYSTLSLYLSLYPPNLTITLRHVYPLRSCPAVRQ
jgi:hypothetical protein